MRTLPQELVDELQLEFSRLGHLIEFVLDPADANNNYYYTDMDGDVVWDSGKGFGTRSYLTRGITFDNAQYSLLPKVDNISFEIDNVSLELSAMVMNNETRGKQCNIYRVAFGHSVHLANKNPYGIIGATPLFLGYLDRVEINKQKARFDVFNHFIRWNVPTPRRKHASNCFWTFKGAECGYAGAGAWCDKSWDACVTLANTPAFGGFRWMQSLTSGDRQVLWGRTE